MQPVNDALQALLQGDVHAAEECLSGETESVHTEKLNGQTESVHTEELHNQTKSVRAEKRTKRNVASIRSYRWERRGEVLELHITGDAGDLTGVGTLQAAAQLASFQQFCDAFSLSSTFEATLRILGTCPSSLSLFLCTSALTLFLGNVTLCPMVCETQELRTQMNEKVPMTKEKPPMMNQKVPLTNQKPQLLLKEPLRPSLRALLPQGSTERFLQSSQWAVELPLTLEEADEWTNQLSETCTLDLSHLPQCTRVLDLLRVSLLEELLYWKSELLVGTDCECEW